MTVNFTELEVVTELDLERSSKIWDNPRSSPNVVDSFLRINSWQFEDEGRLFPWKMYAVSVGDSIAGYTGYYVSSKTPHSCGLSWTGFLPAYRGLGLLRRSIRAMEGEIAKNHSGILYLTELIPSHRNDLIPVFTKLGFSVIQDFYGESASSYQESESDDYFLNCTMMRLCIR